MLDRVHAIQRHVFHHRSGSRPTAAPGCGTITVDGTYNQSLTIASDNDIVIDGNITHTGNALLGLIAQNYVRVYHPCSGTGGSNQAGYLANPSDRRRDPRRHRLVHRRQLRLWLAGSARQPLRVRRDRPGLPRTRRHRSARPATSRTTSTTTACASRSRRTSSTRSRRRGASSVRRSAHAGRQAVRSEGRRAATHAPDRRRPWDNVATRPSCDDGEWCSGRHTVTLDAVKPRFEPWLPSLHKCAVSEFSVRHAN